MSFNRTIKRAVYWAIGFYMYLWIQVRFLYYYYLYKLYQAGR